MYEKDLPICPGVPSYERKIVQVDLIALQYIPFAGSIAHLLRCVRVDRWRGFSINSPLKSLLVWAAQRNLNQLIRASLYCCGSAMLLSFYLLEEETITQFLRNICEQSPSQRANFPCRN